MTVSRYSFWAGLFFLILFPHAANAAGEIKVGKTIAKQLAAGRYEISAVIYNQTSETREVVLRAQLFFFEDYAPQGDKPVMILRKDETLVFKKKEGRTIIFKLLNEGTLPKAKLRLKPEVRIRRQREWQY